MLVKRSVSLSGHRTSIALEPEFWAALDAMAAARRETTADLIRSIDESRDPASALASALRVATLHEALARAPDHRD